jgi:uncharacterized repeat protein (TIGR01451 family)
MYFRTKIAIFTALLLLAGFSFLPAQPLIHDVGCSAILIPGEIVDSGATITPACSVTNYGTQTSTNFAARMKISYRDYCVYNQSWMITMLPPGTTFYVTFMSWTADVPLGEIMVSCSTELMGDENPANDKMAHTARVQRPDTGRICGTVFRDDNGNGQRDSGEPGLHNWTVMLTPGPRFAMSDDQGNYVLDHLAPNTYTVREFVKKYWEQTFPPSPGTHTVTLGSGQTVTGKDYGNLLTPVQDLTASVVGSRARTGFEKVLAIRYENKGTLDQNATLRLTLPPPGEATYRSSTQGGVYVPGDHAVVWNLGLVPVGDIGWPQVTVMVDAPMGTDIASFVTIEPITGDTTPEDNVDSDTEYVHNSQDPNEKLVLPKDSIDQTAVIEYTILFQNVGNDTAYDITVRDTLDSNLDISTLEIGAASHPYIFGIGDSRELIWNFEHIMLPDSGANQLGSNGALKFTVHTLPNLPVGTHVDNTAAIYFDLNDAVVTNTARVTVRSPAVPPEPGWRTLSSVPAGPKNKRIKDGGCLAALDPSSIYALKGNNTCELYGFNPTTNVWFLSDTIPSLDPSGKKHGARKGATLTAAGGKLYFTKGKGTDGFWSWDPSTDRPIVRLIPPPPRSIEQLWHATSAEVGDTDCIYFLEQAGTSGFLRYNTLADSWQIMTSAPLGASGKTYKKGSSVASDGLSTIYSLKGNYNEFYAYDVTANTWITKASLPMVNRDGKKKKAGDGAALAYLGGYVYCQKGNNTLEIWRYDPSTDAWTQLEDMPNGCGRRIKGGGALTAGNGKLYAFKGNNTLEFYSYTPATFFSLPRTADQNAMINSVRPLTIAGVKIAPNPILTRATISYSLSKAGNVSLKLYDMTGKLVTTLATGYHTAGTSSFIVHRSSLSSGIYILKLESDNTTASQKLILQ